MKAVVKCAPGEGHVELREVPEPDCGEGQVKIEVKAAGVCGSDIHILHDDIAIPMKLPVVMGHEFSGMIVDVGGAVEGFSVGDRITAETTFESCGQCYYCLRQEYNLCGQRRGIGYWYDGAFSKYVIINRERLYRLPDSISYEEGAMSEPLACVVHAVAELTKIRPKDFVVIFGPGPIGLLALQVVTALGGRACLCGIAQDGKRLKLGRQLGAEMVVNLGEASIHEMVKEQTEGLGADVVVECSGSEAAADTGFEVVRKGGQYLQVGLFGAPIRLDFAKIAYKEIKATGSFSQKRSAWLKTMELLEGGKVQLKPLISHRFALEDWQKAFEVSQSKTGLKVVFSAEAAANR